MIKGMLHRKNTKLINKLVAAIFLAAMLVSAPSFSKQTKNKSAPKKVAPAADLSAEDKLFVELREAAKVNDVAKTRTLGSKLEGHDLSDYVLYFQIKPQIYDKGAQARVDSSADAAVEAFLKVNAGSAIADRLRNDWLLVLGKRKDWSNFDKEYVQFVLNDDTQVKCYAIQSRQAKGEDAKHLGLELKNILLDAQYFGEACPEAAQNIYKAGGLSKQELAAMGRIALENNYEGLSKKFGVDDPIAETVKKARTDPAQAYKEFEKKEWGTGKRIRLQLGV